MRVDRQTESFPLCRHLIGTSRNPYRHFIQLDTGAVLEMQFAHTNCISRTFAQFHFGQLVLQTEDWEKRSILIRKLEMLSFNSLE